MQLNMFAPEPTEEPKYPWLTCFPDWFPKVGGRAQIHDVCLEKYGYVYMERITITAIEGEKVTAIVDYRLEHMKYADGQERILSLKNLWPPVMEGIEF